MWLLPVNSEILYVISYKNRVRLTNIVCINLAISIQKKKKCRIGGRRNAIEMVTAILQRILAKLVIILITWSWPITGRAFISVLDAHPDPEVV